MCSSVTYIDFFSLVKIEVDISYTFGAAENKTNACPENSLVVQSFSLLTLLLANIKLIVKQKIGSLYQ